MTKTLVKRHKYILTEISLGHIINLCQNLQKCQKKSKRDDKVLLGKYISGQRKASLLRSMDIYEQEKETIQIRKLTTPSNSSGIGYLKQISIKFSLNGNRWIIQKTNTQVLTELTVLRDISSVICKSSLIKRIERRENKKNSFCGGRRYFNIQWMMSSLQYTHQSNMRGWPQAYQEEIFHQSQVEQEKVPVVINGNLTKN